jgi:vanillate/3-O-methylgallate O-demethylase
MPTLQDRINAAGSPVKMHATPMPPLYVTPYPWVHSNWRREQRAWGMTAVIFDQSYHMTDLYITGRDTVKLLSDTSVNSYAQFGANKAKQYLCVNEQGYVIGDSILFGMSAEESSIVAGPVCANWLQYQAKVGGYQVKFVREERNMAGPTPKRLYRYNMEGPHVWKILEKAAGKKLGLIKFFQMGELPIAGRTVRALNHTMGGVPGDDLTGLELFGPEADGPEVLAAILEAGKEFGLLRGGVAAYASTMLESGWLGLVMPAIYGDEMKPYRQWLEEHSAEGYFPISGSFRSERIEDYYVTPWDLGYGHMVKFDHDFIGRSALEKIRDKPARTKVWFTWNAADAARVIASGEIGDETGAKLMQLPLHYGTYDRVLDGNRLIGLAVLHGHTANLGGITSVGYVNTEDAVDGKQVEILWGDPDGGASNPYTFPHKQTTARVTLRKQSPAAK